MKSIILKLYKYVQNSCKSTEVEQLQKNTKGINSANQKAIAGTVDERMNMTMIDIHSHILPMVDDGAPDLSTALEMLDIAEQNGTVAMFATPHVIEKHTSLAWSEILVRTNELQQQALLSGLKIKIYPGAELEMNWDLLPLLADKGHYCLAGSNYLLLELPGSMIPLHADEFLFELKIRGVTPIIAHPERHPALMGDAATLRRWKNTGSLFQCNAGSFAGLYGEVVKRNVEHLLQEELVDFIASDAHNSLRRNTNMSPCVRRIVELKDEAFVEKLMCESPLRILTESSKIKYGGIYAG